MNLNVVFVPPDKAGFLNHWRMLKRRLTMFRFTHFCVRNISKA